MADGPRRIHIVTSDELLESSIKTAAHPLKDWVTAPRVTVEGLLKSPPTPGDVIMLDGAMREQNVYEACRRLVGHTRCRTFVVVRAANAELAEPIANFCGATAALPLPLQSEVLRHALANTAPPPPPESDFRGAGGPTGESLLPARLLADLVGEPSESLIDVLTDPDTSLFNYEYLTFKLDEEYKRARRFWYPLSCVMLGFEGQCDEAALRRLAGIFMDASRDTDILGRFDENSFLFLLPHTGPDGAATMAQRIRKMAEERGIEDLVGDRLSLAIGISSFPHTEVHRREDLYARVRESFFRARQEGGGLVLAT